MGRHARAVDRVCRRNLLGSRSVCNSLVSVVIKAGPNHRGGSRFVCFGAINVSCISIVLTGRVCGGIITRKLKRGTVVRRGSVFSMSRGFVMGWGEPCVEGAKDGKLRGVFKNSVPPPDSGFRCMVTTRIFLTWLVSWMISWTGRGHGG